jgi:hypothetical protein
MARTQLQGGTSNQAGESKDVALQVMVPERIKREVSVLAAQEGTTQRTIILRALKSIGLIVQDGEMCDRRKAR